MLKKYRVLIFTVIVILFFATVFFAGYFGVKPESESKKSGGCCGMESSAENDENCNCSSSDSGETTQKGEAKGTVDKAAPK